MLEQAELRSIPMGPNDPPHAKRTAQQIAPGIAILENQAFWVILLAVLVGKPPSCHLDTPGQGIYPRGHGNLFDKKSVGVFVSLV